jgi:hypothetical protein
MHIGSLLSQRLPAYKKQTYLPHPNHFVSLVALDSSQMNTDWFKTAITAHLRCSCCVPNSLCKQDDSHSAFCNKIQVCQSHYVACNATHSHRRLITPTFDRGHKNKNWNIRHNAAHPSLAYETLKILNAATLLIRIHSPNMKHTYSFMRHSLHISNTKRSKMTDFSYYNQGYACSYHSSVASSITGKKLPSRN